MQFRFCGCFGGTDPDKKSLFQHVHQFNEQTLHFHVDHVWGFHLISPAAKLKIYQTKMILIRSYETAILFLFF